MSMFSMISSRSAPRVDGLLERVEVDHHQIDRPMPCSSIAAACSGLSRTPSRPPWTIGCSVFTRPSIISGKPVRSETSRTSRPASRKLRGRAAGRDELDTVPRQARRQLGEAALVAKVGGRHLEASQGSLRLDGLGQGDQAGLHQLGGLPSAAASVIPSVWPARGTTSSPMVSWYLFCGLGYMT